MKLSSNITTQTRDIDYVSEIDPARATIEETDAWIVSIGGRELSREEMTQIVNETRWADVPDENPGDPEFPLSPYSVWG